MKFSDTDQLPWSNLYDVWWVPIIVNPVIPTRILDALSSHSRFQLPRNHSISIRLARWGKINLYIGKWTELTILSKDSFLSSINNANFTVEVPYLVVTQWFIQKFPNKWYKWLRKFERVILWRNAKGYHADVSNRLDLWGDECISGVHLSVELSEDNIITITDLHSTNGTFCSFSWWEVLPTDPRQNIKQDFSARNQDSINKDPILAWLWPNIHRWMQQWPVWNCYFVAAMNAIKTHSQWYELLKWMIEQLPNEDYRVFFRGINRYTDISMADIHGMWDEKMEWSLGDHVLERAYWRLRFNKLWTNFKTWFSFEEATESGLRRMPAHGSTLRAVTTRGYKVHEFWSSVDVFSDFFGDIVNTESHGLWVIPWVKKWSLMDLLKNSLNQEYILTLSTVNLRALAMHPQLSRRDLIGIMQRYFPVGCNLYSSLVSSEFNFKNVLPEDVYDLLVTKILIWQIQWGDAQKFSMSDIHDRECWLYFWHAYSVGEVNTEAWFIEVINPHDTVNERFKFPIVSIDRLFWYLSIIELR